MANPKLFEPITIGGQKLRNRIVIAPMCQYSAVDGQMTDWHLIHLGHLALSGAAVLTIEATAVEPEGRITYADVGLWSDATEAAIRALLKVPSLVGHPHCDPAGPCGPEGVGRSAVERWSPASG